MTPWAAKWAACWLEPHWRSIVVPGTLSGQPAASTALRPTLSPCSPTCITQPITTSSTVPGSMPVRSTSAFRVSAARSTGCQSLSCPLRLPSGVRTASMITAFVTARTVALLLPGGTGGGRPVTPGRPDRRRHGARRCSSSSSHIAKCRCTARRYVTFISRHSARPRRVSSTVTERWSTSPPSRRTTQPSSSSRSSRRLRLERTRRSSDASSLGRADPPQRCSAASTSNHPSDRSHSARRSVSIARSSAAATDCSSRHAETLVASSRATSAESRSRECRSGRRQRRPLLGREGERIVDPGAARRAGRGTSSRTSGR